MKKMEVLFIQGGGKGAYKEDEKLATSLEDSLGQPYEIHYPKMPKENDPDYDLYKARMEKELGRIEGELILVGHSLGACFLLKYLAEAAMEKQVAGIFLMATPFWGPGGWQYEGFTLDNELASKRTAKIPLVFYHSTNDEVVPFSHLALYKAKFPHAKFREITDRGHQFGNDVTEIVKDIKESAPV